LMASAVCLLGSEGPAASMAAVGGVRCLEAVVARIVSAACPHVTPYRVRKSSGPAFSDMHMVRT